MPGVTVVAVLADRDLTAEPGEHAQGVGVGHARQDDPRAGGVHDDPGPVLAPPLAQLRLAVHHGDDLDALAAGVGQPLRQRHRAYLGDLVEREQHRVGQPAAGE